MVFMFGNSLIGDGSGRENRRNLVTITKHVPTGDSDLMPTASNRVKQNCIKTKIVGRPGTADRVLPLKQLTPCGSHPVLTIPDGY